VKLQTSNLASTFIGSIRTKARKKFRRKGSVGVHRDCPSTPLLSQERVKLRTSNFVRTFIGSIATKAHENFLKCSRGRTQGLSKIFRAPIHKAHRAAIFAVAQLSCCVQVSADCSARPISRLETLPLRFLTVAECPSYTAVHRWRSGIRCCKWRTRKTLLPRDATHNAVILRP